jgi:hypothetical protein
MEARHLFVYHTGTNRMLYSKTTGNGKLFPASITKLFSTYVALQYLDPNTIITAGNELDLVRRRVNITGILGFPWQRSSVGCIHTKRCRGCRKTFALNGRLSLSLDRRRPADGKSRDDK